MFNLVFLCIVLIAFVYSEQDDCKVANIDLPWAVNLGHVNARINDSQTGTVEEWNTTNVKDIYFYDPKYLNVTFENQKATFFTTEEYKSYEENETRDMFSENLHVVCNNGQNYNISYKQFVRDNNNHDPIFDRTEYNYVIYTTGLKKGFVLTNLLPITATDGDFTTSYLFAKIYPNSDDIIFLAGGKTNKIFKFQASLNKSISAPYDKTVTISIRDDDISKNITAILHLRLFEEDAEIKFLKNMYEGEVMAHGDVIIDNNECITLIGGDMETKFTITGENATHFFTIMNIAQNCISLKYWPTINNDIFGTFIINLHANWKGLKATTKVVVNVKEEIKTTTNAPVTDVPTTSDYTTSNINTPTTTDSQTEEDSTTTSVTSTPTTTDSQTEEDSTTTSVTSTTTESNGEKIRVYNFHMLLCFFFTMIIIF